MNLYAIFKQQIKYIVQYSYYQIHSILKIKERNWRQRWTMCSLPQIWSEIRNTVSYP